MAGTRDLAAVIDQATRVGAKVVLVGDHHQLPEVAAGGAFRAALDTLGDRVVELTVNRRQQHEWEQAALDQLRCGDVATAFAAYRDHGRVVITDNPDDLHALASPTGTPPAAAGRHAAARRHPRRSPPAQPARPRRCSPRPGELDLDHEFEFAGRGFAPGDQVVLCRNHPAQHLANGERFAVDNGMRGTITGLDHDGMHVTMTTGEDVVLDRRYLDHGWVDHAYAVTIHKAQGVTCDHVLVVGPAGLYREGDLRRPVPGAAQRLALRHRSPSRRARTPRHGIPLPTEADPDPEARAPRPTPHLRRQEPRHRRRPRRRTRRASSPPPSPPASCSSAPRTPATPSTPCGVDNPAELRAAYDAAVAARSHLDVGRRVRALDRDNVGHVIAIDDNAGTCLVHFDNDRRPHAPTRRSPGTTSSSSTNPDPVALSPAAAATLARLADRRRRRRTGMGDRAVRLRRRTRRRRPLPARRPRRRRPRRPPTPRRPNPTG